MPKLVPISHRELARKLRRAGFVEIRTSRHPVYYLAAKDLTSRISSDLPPAFRKTQRDFNDAIEQIAEAMLAVAHATDERAPPSTLSE